VQTILLALLVWIIVGGGVLVVRVVSCSLLSVQKPLCTVNYHSKYVLPSGWKTHSVVFERRKTFIYPSFRVPVSDGHIGNKQEEKSKEDRPPNNLSFLRKTLVT
jgi:hypothetical protein